MFLQFKLLPRFPGCFLGCTHKCYSSTAEMYPGTPGSMVTAMMCSNATWPFDREGQKLYVHANLPWEGFKMRPQQGAHPPTARDFSALELLEYEKRQREWKRLLYLLLFLCVLLVQHGSLCCASDWEKDGLIPFLLELLIIILSSGETYAYF